MTITRGGYETLFNSSQCLLTGVKVKYFVDVKVNNAYISSPIGQSFLQKLVVRTDFELSRAIGQPIISQTVILFNFTLLLYGLYFSRNDQTAQCG